MSNTKNTTFNKTKYENVISSPNSGAQIVLGQDRKREPNSGYGVLNQRPDVSSIEAVVGRGAKVESDDRPGEALVNVSHPNDAAKIYISEKSDPDDYFKFRLGNGDKSIAQSTIVLHADTIRIGAREKLKLITGTSADGKLSNNSIAEMHGIELIAGGGKKTQPMVLGDNLVAYLTDLNSCITELNGHVTNLTKMLTELTINYAAHIHPIITPAPGSPTAPSPMAVQASISIGTSLVPLILELSSTAQAVQRLELDKTLNPLSDEYILSNYNRCN